MANRSSYISCVLLSISSYFFVNTALANTPSDVYQQCIACHGEQGQGNDALNAPAIAGQYAWYIQRQLEHFVNGVRGSDEQDTGGQQMRAAVASFEPAEIKALADYIQTLNGKPAKMQLSGDLKNGARYYQAKCGACHGGQAEGNPSFNAPKLVNQSNKYLQQQIENFAKGIRGKHPSDKLGKQMAMMAKVVNEQELADILYFIAEQE